MLREVVAGLKDSLHSGRSFKNNSQLIFDGYARERKYKIGILEEYLRYASFSTPYFQMYQVLASIL